MWQFITEYWAGWLCALIGGAILAAIPKIKALWDAVLALLHDRTYTESYRFMDLGYITRDGRRIEIGANVASPREAAEAFANGADGVGLLRTEFLFLERRAAPDEEEQRNAYQEVLDAIRAESGFAVRVLSGEEEAEFDYYGALQSTPLDGGLLVDVGGGSTELVYFTKRKAVLGVSLPIGSLTLYNRFVDGILPSRGEVRKIEAEAAAQIEAARLRIRSGAAKQIVAVGGTARAALKLRNSLEGKSGNSAYETSFYGDFLSQMEMGPEKLTGRILDRKSTRLNSSHRT